MISGADNARLELGMGDGGGLKIGRRQLGLDAEHDVKVRGNEFTGDCLASVCLEADETESFAETGHPLPDYEEQRDAKRVLYRPAPQNILK